MLNEVAEEDSDWETIVEDCEISSEDDSESGFPAIDVDCEDWAEKFTMSIRRFHNNGNYSNHIDEPMSESAGWQKVL